eukprot:Tbor_TRINITY_DN1613_c0_g1::TRINITY_DN1613_c0_g1_i1::g.7599::m.7599/K15115/SLC25A32, MFT; solute carrier family 25 (mitochondrial folate transporter), member 32
MTTNQISLLTTTPNTTTTTKNDTAAVSPKVHTSIQHTLASQGAGAFSTIFFFPFDVVKMRFMSQDGTKQRLHNNTYYRSTLHSITDIYQSEGIRSLYYGAQVAVIGSVTAWGIYMYLYQSLQGYQILENDFLNKSLVSTIASVTSAVLGCPLFILKTRMQIEDRSSAGRQAAGCPTGAYRTISGGLRHIIATSGPLSLWRGVGVQILLGIPNALYMPVYEALKQQVLNISKKGQLDAHEVLGCTVLTKTVILIIAHPLYVIKTRIQDHRSMLGDVKYHRFIDSVSTTVKREGIRGLYRGSGPALLVAVPRVVCHFFVYEALLRL